MAEEKNKKEFVDDGRTIVSMDFDHYSNKSELNKKRQEISELNITRKEQWAMIKAMYLNLLPVLLIMLVSFFLVFLLFYLLFS